MSSIYKVRQGESISDCILNSTGDLSNWEDILTANKFQTWTPDLYPGQEIIIPDTITVQPNAKSALDVYPAINNTYSADLQAQIDDLINSPIIRDYGLLYNFFAATYKGPLNIIYGLLYNWYAATDARNIAPAGWHVPTPDEIQALFGYLDPSYNYGDLMSNTAGSYLKEIGTTHWDDPDSSDNSSGFSARGAGSRLYDVGSFDALLASLYLWCQADVNGFWFMSIPSAWADASLQNYTDESLKKYGYSIRLIKDDSTDPGTVTGNDGKVYPTVKIGSQVWIACNSAETKYRNGDLIPEVTDNSAWAALSTGALCAYNDDWSNVYSQVSIAPAGWHLPIDDDWNTLSIYLSTNVGGKLKEIGFTYWDSPNSGATNEVGFNGRGGGNRYGIIYPGQFMYIKEHGTFWSSELYMTSYAYHRDLVWNGTDLVKFYVLQNYGLSIRLIRNSTTLTNGQTSTVTDIDGNVYSTICIGNQEWMSANLAVTHYNDGTEIPNIIDDTAWCALTTGAYCVYGKAIQVVPVGPSGSGITADDTTHTADDTTITVDG